MKVEKTKRKTISVYGKSLFDHLDEVVISLKKEVPLEDAICV